MCRILTFGLLKSELHTCEYQHSWRSQSCTPECCNLLGSPGPAPPTWCSPGELWTLSGCCSRQLSADFWKCWLTFYRIWDVLLFWVSEDVCDICLEWEMTSRVLCDKLAIEIHHGCVVNTPKPGASWDYYWVFFESFHPTLTGASPWSLAILGKHRTECHTRPSPHNPYTRCQNIQPNRI